MTSFFALGFSNGSSQTLHQSRVIHQLSFCELDQPSNCVVFLPVAANSERLSPRGLAAGRTACKKLAKVVYTLVRWLYAGFSPSFFLHLSPHRLCSVTDTVIHLKTYRTAREAARKDHKRLIVTATNAVTLPFVSQQCSHYTFGHKTPMSVSGGREFIPELNEIYSVPLRTTKDSVPFRTKD